MRRYGLNIPLCLLVAAIGAAAAGKAQPDLDWWSLKPIVNPVLPSGHKWGRNEVDRFVLEKLLEKGLSPSPESDARTLIRRLTYDLIGLPPSPDEIRSFVQDSRTNAEGAYARLVERLLKSPHHGEQWARYWLDAVRYGESHGYDKDKARFHAWPYRDYVIRSFNEDKPYTRFVQEQVAGDVIWPGNPDGVMALGFVAAGPWDFIAHFEVGEGKLDGRIAKHMDRDDMVSAVFNTFMSTTVQCAQCHDHKFDPVSMSDYYRLHTIFAAVDRADRLYDLDPASEKKRLELENAIGRLEAQRNKFVKKINEAGGDLLSELRAQISDLEKSAGSKLKTVPEHGYHSQIAKDPQTVKWVQLELPKAADIRRIVLIGSHDNFNDIGAGFGFPLRFRVDLSNDRSFRTGVKTVGDYTGKDFINPGVVPVPITTKGTSARFIRVTATKLVERKNDYIFALAEMKVLDATGRNVALDAKVTAKDSIESGRRWGKANLIDRKYTIASDPVGTQSLAALKGELRTLMVQLQTPDTRAKRERIAKQLAARKKQLNALPKGKLVYAIATHFKTFGKVTPSNGKPRDIHLLNRGDLRSPGDLMKPGAPVLWNTTDAEFALSSPADEGARRRALAEYLTAPDNPLTWRSIVNRIWLHHMGRGIVDSPNDFGRMGMKPTHPELLDWLAHRFRERQSIKDLHRLIVMSSTYRQSSAFSTDMAAIDDSNQYYSRMHRRKLRAEELRDAVLSVAGKLNPKVGGPSYQDFKFMDDHTPKYQYHLHDENDSESHRRSIYRFIARSQPHPFMTALDCADPSQMVPKRDETTTALQALALMNNPFMTAMSEHLAKRVEDANSPITKAIWLAVGRAPTKMELTSLNEYLAKHGLANACRLIFNLNEFAYLD